jgi:predicted secreted protein
LAMQWTSALAIFVLFWWLCLFLVLPFHARQRREGDALVPGQADSAPMSFSFWRVAGQVTLLASAIFVLYYANYVAGWVTLDDVNPYEAPPRS